MATVTFDRQCFSIDKRRIWILGAGLQYTRIPVAQWADRLRAAREAGFNTIATACPWSLHEPRPGRFFFKEQANLRGFVELCGELDLRVIIRPGPYVGTGFDGGGLPIWLGEIEGIRFRQTNEAFLGRIGSYLRRVVNEVKDLQATQGGPIILFESEYAWLNTPDDTAKKEPASKYILDVTRLLRENGVAVPIINTNDLWQDESTTIDTWRGRQDLLAHVRQLRSLRPTAPTIVSELQVADAPMWGRKPDMPDAAVVVRQAAEVLAAGGQFVAHPFHGGTNLGFGAGRLAGPDGGFLTAAAAAGAPLGEAGARGDLYLRLKRLVSFANAFTPIFTEYEQERAPIVLDPAESAQSASKSPAVSIVPVPGPRGRAVFIFSNGKAKSTTLLLEDGLRLPVPLGPDLVHWLVLDADLDGSGRLDYVNVSPVALVDRRIVVLHGPDRATVMLSVNGSPLEATVPSGRKPLVIKHRELTFVICNSKQIDTMYHTADTVYVGAAGLDADGAPIAAAADGKVIAIRHGEKPQTEHHATRPASTRRRAINDWKASPATMFVDGTAPRFASLGGPATLADCGASEGYGWYRFEVKSTSAAKRLLHLPDAGDRLHLFIDGGAAAVIGDGPGAASSPFEMKFGKGKHSIVVLADNFGRMADGTELGWRAGIWGDLLEVKPLRSVKAKVVDEAPIDPLGLIHYIAERAIGHRSSPHHLAWSFTHAKKTPILIEIHDTPCGGTWIINDEPHAYDAGAAGICRLRMQNGETESMKRGKNTIRFAPDDRDPAVAAAMAKSSAVYETLAGASTSTSWAFAKWQPPAPSTFKAVTKHEAAGHKGMPCWWSASFDVPLDGTPVWIETAGLTKGQLFVNGHNLTRYFTGTAHRKAVGPQTRFLAPDGFLKTKGNTLMIFDEHGAHPFGVKIVLTDRGELD